MRKYRLLATAGLATVLSASGVTATAFGPIRLDQAYSRPSGPLRQSDRTSSGPTALRLLTVRLPGEDR